jgi:hypothetical protein
MQRGFAERGDGSRSLPAGAAVKVSVWPGNPEEGHRQMRLLISRRLPETAAVRGLLTCRIAPIALAILLAGFYSSIARAGIFEDQLNQCIGASVKGADHTVLVQWLFSISSLNAAIQQQSKVTTQERDAMVKNVEALFSRLLTDNCRKEALVALKYEEVPNVLPPAFQVLTDIAMRDLVTDPQVSKAMNSIKNYMDRDEKLGDLINDAKTADQEPGKN